MVQRLVGEVIDGEDVADVVPDFGIEGTVVGGSELVGDAACASQVQDE